MPDQPPPSSALVRTLPSGRSVLVAESAADGETLSILAPDGRAEVEILLTPAGPVVRVHGARLEVASASDVAVRCRSLELDAADGVRITGGEFRVRTERAIHLNGETVRLNCTEDGAPEGARPPGERPASAGRCCPGD